MLERIRRDLRASLSERRYRHVQGVVETAKRLSPRVGVDLRQAELAALLHDLCKEWPTDSLSDVLRRHHDTVWLDFSPLIWHAPAASYVARERYGIEDVAVLEAVYYHSTGRGAMGPLDLVLWVADYIEPGRDFEGVEVARRLAEVDLALAFRYAIKETILDLLERDETIHPTTWQAYNAYTRKTKRGAPFRIDRFTEA
ncbi:MAG: bis(5'-nucleosyl)-tetraphosphatase (symmetrical) YqeK [Hydrogenibacillus sp.]|nr:bis(5'-nucleosyl)-tetraphosphatase (symmetrical) YqeK [Hydrogenibacillus sp.]